MKLNFYLFVINKTIGKGGYAYVKLAQHEETKKTCALKIMKRDKKSSIIQEVYENEVSIMMELWQLNHPFHHRINKSK